MKITPLFAISAFLFAAEASTAATIDLLPQGGNTTLPDHHVDSYLLPSEMIGSDLITRITVTLVPAPGSSLNGANMNPGGQPTPLRDPLVLGTDIDNDTHLLIAPSSNITISNVTETSSMFSVQLDFTEAVTFSVWGAALRSINGTGDGLTTLTWVVDYQNGSQKTFIDGIIPEPSTALMSLGGAALLFSGRRRA